MSYVLTKHSKERFSQRITYRDKMDEEVRLAKKRGVKNKNLPNNPHFDYLEKYLKRNKIYYNGNIYCFAGGSYNQLRTCYPAKPEIKKLGDEAYELIHKEENAKKEQEKLEAPEIKRTNLYIPSLYMYTTVITKKGQIVFVYIGKPKKTEDVKQSFAAYLEKDFVGYVEKGNPLKTGYMFDDTPEDYIPIYQEVKKVKFGHTITFKEIADNCGVSVPKVVAALKFCKLVLVIPTHRVVCSNGKIGSYKYSKDAALKKRMLEMEQKEMQRRKNN